MLRRPTFSDLICRLTTRHIVSRGDSESERNQSFALAIFTILLSTGEYIYGDAMQSYKLKIVLSNSLNHRNRLHMLYYRLAAAKWTMAVGPMS